MKLSSVLFETIHHDNPRAELFKLHARDLVPAKRFPSWIPWALGLVALFALSYAAGKIAAVIFTSPGYVLSERNP